jgi:hypothetical protein
MFHLIWDSSRAKDLSLRRLFTHLRQHFFNELLEVFPGVEMGSLPGYQMFDSTCAGVNGRFSRNPELHNKDTVAWKCRACVLHDPNLFVAGFLLSCSKKQDREIQGKDIRLNGQDFGQE